MAAVFTCILYILPIGVEAAEYGMTMQGGLFITSNGTQSPVPAWDKYLDFIWGGTYLNKTPRLTADIKGSVEATAFRNTTGDTIYPRGDATINAVLLKERLDWYVRDRAEVVRIDTLQADTPTNQEIANVLITGPTAMARFGPADRGIAEARYEVATYQKSAIKDSWKYIGALRWERTVSPSKLFSANIEARSVHAYQYYRKFDGYFSYVSTRPTSTFKLNLGTMLIDQYMGTQINEGTYLFDYGYKPNSRTLWSITADRQFSDSSEALVLPVVPGDPLTRDAGMFLQEGSSLNYSYTYAEDKAIVGLFKRRRDYIQTAIGEDAKGFRFDYTKQADRASSWRFTGMYSDTLYSDSPDNDIEREVGAEYGFGVNREVTWKTGLIYRDRKSAIAARSFTETVFYTYFLLTRLNVHP